MSGEGLGCITLKTERCSTLLLIEPDGGEKVVALSAAEEKAARAEAKEKAKREAAEKTRLAAEAQAKAEKLAQEKLAKEKKAKEATARKAKANKEAEEKARRKEEAAKAAAQAEAQAAVERKAKEALAKEKLEAQAKAAAKAKADAETAKVAAKKAAPKAPAKASPKTKPAKPKSNGKPTSEPRDLGQTFRRLIRETGPISLAHYMAESNALYYTSRDPLGAESDFITAPEISQMFGELIGLWFADLWVKMGSREHIHYVELGPGKGTLAKDAMRVAARYKFDPQVHFVETSPALRAVQKEAFPNAQFHDDLSSLPEDAPLLIVANEFFDALPVHQLVRSAQGWHERMIGLDGDAFAYVAGDKPMDAIVPKSWAKASQGTMIETSPASSAVMAEIAQRLKNQGGAALVIDYGPFEQRAGSTLQAIRAHKKVDPLEHPGEADLTAHVDFELLKQVAEREGADVMGLTMQGDWLRNMGIELRHEALLRQNPQEKDKLERQFNRLVDDGQMGTLFKVLGLCGRRWPFGAGFD